MKTVTLSAHVEGNQIKLDEPFEIPSDARLLVTVLPPVEPQGGAEEAFEKAELKDWAERAKRSRKAWLAENPY